MELLQKTPLFKDCAREELEIALGFFQERQIKAGAIIFTENMPAEALYVIKSGSVRITVMAGEGVEAGLLLLGPGEFFGELALIHEEKRQVTARAETAAEMLLLTRKDFQALMDLEPRAYARVMTEIAKLLAIRVQAYSLVLKEHLIS